MSTFFSSTDDKYELGDPGIHIVVGGIILQTRKYSINASVVSGGRRFLVPYGAIIDAYPVENCTFHKNVLKYVEYIPTKHVYQTTHVGRNYNYSNKSAYNQWHNKKFSQKEEPESYKDPFFFQDGYHGDGNNYYDDIPGCFDGSPVIQLHQIEDILIDFLKQNDENLLTLTELEESLSGYLNDIREKIESPELIKF
jgi:hypothetical protein